MTYIFGGIDLPVFEILFIVSIVLMVGLAMMIFGIFYILKELKTLQGLLREEETDIKEFDSDISALEQLEGKKAKEKVRQYIRSSTAKGMSWDDIRKELLKRGWKNDVIDSLHNRGDA